MLKRILIALSLSFVACTADTRYGAVEQLELTNEGVLTTDDLVVNDVSTFGDYSTMASSNASNPTLSITHTPVGATTSYIPSLYVTNYGTYDTTSSGLNAPAVYGECAASRSAGSNTLICSGVYGYASGTAPDSRAVRGVTTGNFSGATNYAGAFTTTSNGSGSLNWGVYASATGSVSGGVNYGVYAAASGASVANWALYTLTGDVALNASTGATYTFGDVHLGDTDADKLNLYAKPYARGSAPTLSSCGTSPTVSGNDKAGVITTGTGAPSACTLTFNTAWATNAPICVVSLGASGVVSHVSSVSTTALTIGLDVGTSGITIYYQCVGKL